MGNEGSFKMENSMDELKELKIKLEEARTQLNQMVKNNKNNIFNEEIIKLSQVLDDLLLDYIKKSSK